MEEDNAVDFNVKHAHSGHAFDPSKPRLRSSIFWVTINTNQSHTGSMAESYAGELEAVLDEIFTPENMNSLIVWRGPGPGKGPGIDPNYAEGTERTFAKPFIESFEMEHVTEEGPRYHKIHAHALVKVIHRTYIHLDQDEIARQVSERMNLGGIHVNVRPFKTMQAVYNYMLKTLNKPGGF